MQLSSEDQGLIRVMGLNYHLRHASKWVSPNDSKLHPTQKGPD